MWWYELDDADTVTAVSSDWDEFALANDGAGAVAAEVLGRPLWSFISDAETHALLRALLKRARAGNLDPVPFRCDAPDAERWHTFHAEARENGRLRVTCTLDRERLRDAVPLLQRRRAVSDGVLRMCSWCNRLWSGSEWIDTGDAVGGLLLFDSGPLPLLTHGICDDCSDSVLGDLEPLPD